MWKAKFFLMPILFSFTNVWEQKMNQNHNIFVFVFTVFLVGVWFNISRLFFVAT